MQDDVMQEGTRHPYTYSSHETQYVHDIVMRSLVFEKLSNGDPMSLISSWNVNIHTLLSESHMLPKILHTLTQDIANNLHKIYCIRSLDWSP